MMSMNHTHYKTNLPFHWSDISRPSTIYTSRYPNHDLKAEFKRVNKQVVDNMYKLSDTICLIRRADYTICSVLIKRRSHFG